MLLPVIKTRRKQVIIDVNTQRDFLVASGKACIRNHRRVLAHIRRVMAWARANDFPVVSLCDTRCNHLVILAADTLDPPGAQKVSYTLLNDRIVFAADSNTDLPKDVLRDHHQVILHKRCLDPFDEPRIDRLLSETRTGDCVVIGTTTEGDIQATVLGLLQRNRRVTLVVDAVGTHDPQEARLALRKMEAKGANLVETRKLAGLSHLRLVGACRCMCCQRLLGKDGGGSEDAWPSPYEHLAHRPARGLRRR